MPNHDKNNSTATTTKMDGIAYASYILSLLPNVPVVKLIANLLITGEVFYSQNQVKFDTTGRIKNIVGDMDSRIATQEQTLWQQYEHSYQKIEAWHGIDAQVELPSILPRPLVNEWFSVLNILTNVTKFANTLFFLNSISQYILPAVYEVEFPWWATGTFALSSAFASMYYSHKGFDTFEKKLLANLKHMEDEARKYHRRIILASREGLVTEVRKFSEASSSLGAGSSVAGVGEYIPALYGQPLAQAAATRDLEAAGLAGSSESSDHESFHGSVVMTQAFIAASIQNINEYLVFEGVEEVESVIDTLGSMQASILAYSSTAASVDVGNLDGSSNDLADKDMTDLGSSYAGDSDVGSAESDGNTSRPSMVSMGEQREEAPRRPPTAPLPGATNAPTDAGASVRPMTAGL